MEKKLNKRIGLIECIILRKLQLDYLKYNKEKIKNLRFDLTLKSDEDLYFLLELYQTEFIQKTKILKVKTKLNIEFNPN